MRDLESIQAAEALLLIHRSPDIKPWQLAEDMGWDITRTLRALKIWQEVGILTISDGVTRLTDRARRLLQLPEATALEEGTQNG